MSRIIYIGMDVHSQSFSLCAFEPGFDSQGRYFAEVKVPAEPVNIKKYVERLRKSNGDSCRFVTGYEAGCLGFSLYNALVSMNIECVILAPSTMLCPRGGKRIKTDRRDACNIAECLAYGGYSPVHVPSEQDAAVRDYIRMRDDHADMLRAVKQQVCSLCLRNGFCYTAKEWTGAHLKYLREIRLSQLNRECLNEYLATLEQLQEKIKAFDVRIEEMSHTEEYDVKSARMSCFLGITRNRAMSILSEIGDFSRFRSPTSFAAYLGLVPGERSSGADTRRTGITKAGNVHIRKELIEAAQSICRGRTGHKGKALAARQQGNPTDAVAYADKCSERLRRRYYKMINAGKNRNVVVTAIARELACFICGMMQGYAREAA